MSSLSATDAGITFTPGHIYSTLTDSGGFDSGYRNIIEYDASGAVLGSLVIPSLAQEDTLKGIAFGPDGLLYAVKTSYWHSPNDLTVLVLDSSGAVHRTYTNHESSSDIFDGNIAVDLQYIYVAFGSDLVRFTVGEPNSGVSIYSKPEFSVLDVKILPNGHLFVASDYQVDEITDDGTLVRTVVSARNGTDFIDITGVEYDPVNNKLFVAQLGSLASRYQLLRVNASTGAIEAGASFDNAADLFLTESHTLVVGCWTDTPRIYYENWAFVRTIGTAQRMFVTQYIGAPFVTTKPVTNVASYSATLNGLLNPNSSTTTVYFEYGPTTHYGFTTPVQTQIGNFLRNVTANISGLSAITTYHFRIVAHNNHGTRYGSDRIFTTLSATGSPVAFTDPPTLIASFSTTLNGSLDPHGLTTTVYSQYGTTASYGQTTAPESQSGNTYRNITANISGLTASTTYHFRIVATNTADTRYGADRVFTTLSATGAPVVTTNIATNVTSSSAALNGVVDPHGLTTSVYFQYGTTTSYGSTAPMQNQIGSTFRNVSANISGLSAHTVYHFRIVATNSAGNRVGSDRTFTTP